MIATFPRADLKAIRDRLQRFADQARALLDLINGKVLRGADRDRTRQLYREFKEQLRNEYRRGGSVRGEQNMTEAEQLLYHHAIHQAFCELRSPVNCVPGPKLFSEIYAANIDITTALSHVQELLVGGP